MSLLRVATVSLALLFACQWIELVTAKARLRSWNRFLQIVVILALVSTGVFYRREGIPSISPITIAVGILVAQIVLSKRFSLHAMGTLSTGVALCWMIHSILNPDPMSHVFEGPHYRNALFIGQGIAGAIAQILIVATGGAGYFLMVTGRPRISFWSWPIVQILVVPVMLGAWAIQAITAVATESPTEILASGEFLSVVVLAVVFGMFVAGAVRSHATLRENLPEPESALESLHLKLLRGAWIFLTLHLVLIVLWSGWYWGAYWFRMQSDLFLYALWVLVSYLLYLGWWDEERFSVGANSRLGIWSLIAVILAFIAQRGTLWQASTF